MIYQEVLEADYDETTLPPAPSYNTFMSIAPIWIVMKELSLWRIRQLILCLRGIQEMFLPAALGCVAPQQLFCSRESRPAQMRVDA